MNSKMDRRKKYTRMVLKNSLVKLLKEKPLSSITVKEICEIADINRSTFYAHYTDQFDLLNKIEEELIEEMNSYLSQYNFSKEDESIHMTEKLLEYIVTKKDICQTLLNDNGDATFQIRVMTLAQRFLINNWKEENNVDDSVSEYLSTFIISGSIHVIRRWLDRGLDKSPKEMADIINNIINNGISILK